MKTMGHRFLTNSGTLENHSCKHRLDSINFRTKKKSNVKSQATISQPPTFRIISKARETTNGHM